MGEKVIIILKKYHLYQLSVISYQWERKFGSCQKE